MFFGYVSLAQDQGGTFLPCQKSPKRIKFNKCCFRAPRGDYVTVLYFNFNFWSIGFWSAKPSKVRDIVLVGDHSRTLTSASERWPGDAQQRTAYKRIYITCSVMLFSFANIFSSPCFNARYRKHSCYDKSIFRRRHNPPTTDRDPGRSTEPQRNSGLAWRTSSGSDQFASDSRSTPEA